VSFQAYLDNIQTKTGKSPAAFRRLATDKGFAVVGKLKAGVKAGAVVAQNPIRQNHRHVCAVRELLDFLEPAVVHPVVVFAGEAMFKTDVPDGVFTLSKFLAYIESHRTGAAPDANRNPRRSQVVSPASQWRSRWPARMRISPRCFPRVRRRTESAECDIPFAVQEHH